MSKILYNLIYHLRRNHVRTIFALFLGLKVFTKKRKKFTVGNKPIFSYPTQNVSYLLKCTNWYLPRYQIKKKEHLVTIAYLPDGFIMLVT